MSIENVIVELRNQWRAGTITELEIRRRFLDMGYAEDDAARLTRAVLETYLRVLGVTNPELKKLLGICAKELIPQLYHDTLDVELLSLMVKISDVLVADIQNDGQKKIPA